ncbi:SusC/RagA family TonB-linked outer membrane protein [Neptunitalea chrysea]|uniref:SusC/RagA family TonB-linked outer membrane protein n=1 Tax=Neptunitalea chrysea TaxID=1647581 RepID=A0A9W6ETU1_9FLAO|nr:SusC/RagA family TonB-linked outer membrane protein [Neptunitalea chrysea]
MFSSSYALDANKIEETKITINLENVSLTKIFSEISKKSHVTFTYGEFVLKNNTSYKAVYTNETVKNILDNLAKKADFTYIAQEDDVIITESQKVTSTKRLQQLEVTGKVTDETGVPVPGVTVMEKGTSNGVSTDFNGEYKITLQSEDAVLSISYLGYKTIDVSVNGQTSIDISLVPDAAQLDEVVVIGYGTQKKSDLTGSVTSLNEEDLNKGLVTSPEQLIQGKVAGVTVTSASGEPGSAQNITIRGMGSLRSGSTPLYVVDGFALDNTSNGVPTNPLNFLNPQDIESIDVLKDASASAIYGARAANGVIVITTKKGKEGKANMQFTSSVSISSMANKMDVFSASKFRTEVQAIGGTLDDGGANTDWQDVLTRTGISHNLGFSASGGNSDTKYYASVNAENLEGIFANSNLRRYSARVNLTQELFNDRFKVDFNLTGSRTKMERPLITTIVGDMLTMNPTYAAYTDGEPTTTFNNGAFNPLIRQNLYGDDTSNNRILANISPSLEIIKGLTYKLNLGVDYSVTNRNVQNTPNSLPLEEGDLTVNYAENRNTLVENYFTYDVAFNKHSMSFLAGHTYQEIFYVKRSWSYSDFPVNGVEPSYQLEAAGETFTPTSEATINELQSFFGRVNYNYDDRYLLTATFRADGSSKFGDNNKYGYFPSLAMVWRITQEDFMKSQDIFNNLKLRASWGKTGNQEIPSKITQASFEDSTGKNVTYPLYETGDYPVGTIYTRIANPDIQWEVTTQTNIGLDFGFLDGRLSGSVDYFSKVSDNILLEVTPTDPIQPTDTYWTNIPGMKIKNSGVELALDYTQAISDKFKINVGGNVSFIKNKVESSPFKVLTTGSAQGPGLTGATVNGYINGQPIGSFYMKEFLGIDDDGYNIFRDVNGDGESTDDDRVAVGSALPDVNYAFYINMNYKKFDLGLNFNGVAGNKIFNNTALTSFTVGDLSISSNTTDLALQYPNENVNNTSEISTRYLEDGSYLRLNNATLGYTLDSKILGFQDVIKSIRLSVTGQNLFVITNYSGFDPEVNIDYSTGGVQSFGIDYYSYPKARTFLFGLDVNF